MVFSVGAHCFLRNPDLHDGFVDGILLRDGKEVTVLVRDERGQTFSMQLIGTEALLCDDFRQGNIIREVRIVSGIAPNVETLNLLFVPPHPKAAQEFHDGHKQFLKQKIDKIKEGSLTLVSINPSYGCKLIALCREVAISSSA